LEEGDVQGATVSVKAIFEFIEVTEANSSDKNTVSSDSWEVPKNVFYPFYLSSGSVVGMATVSALLISALLVFDA
jgi:hypothetical protein